MGDDLDEQLEGRLEARRGHLDPDPYQSQPASAWSPAPSRSVASIKAIAS